MRLNSSNLEAFYTVSRVLSFSQAAKELNITQSALSQRILNLENSLEAKLFIRESSGVRLTENGIQLLRYCQTQTVLEEEVLTKISASQSSKKSELCGTIRIGGFSSVVRSLLMAKLSPIILSSSKVKLEIFVREMKELPKMLRSGEIDYMILDHLHEDRNLLKVSTIGYEESVLVESSQLKEDRQSIFLDHDSNDQTTLNFLQHQGKRKVAEISRLYLDDIYGILDGVSLGWGRAVVPKHLIAGKKNINIIPHYKTLETPIVLHYYEQPYYSELHKIIIKNLAEEHLFGSL